MAGAAAESKKKSPHGPTNDDVFADVQSCGLEQRSESANSFILGDKMTVEGEQEESALGLTDLEKAYRDILNEDLSPTTIGGMKSCIRAFKH